MSINAANTAVPSAPSRDSQVDVAAGQGAAPNTAAASAPSAAQVKRDYLLRQRANSLRATPLGSGIAALAAPATTVTPASIPALTTAAVTTPGVNTAAVNVTPATPAPVSPFAEIAALPGLIVNTLLQAVGITTAAGVAPSPITPEPLFDWIFASFRRWENEAGFDTPPAPAIVATQTFNGPMIATPTVAQLLNAATTEYVLGGVPGGMVPFTMNGWPMMSMNIWTGEAAQVWVTPQNQIIIAYSGTTGGTNLLFNPLIAISQIITDIQGALTDQTPQAFIDALNFAHQVQAEAARQGYAPDSIFLTGHSLGAWEAQYVAQNTGLAGIGFEGPGLSTTVPGNGANSLFVNVVTYGDPAGFFSSDLPGMQPFTPAYVVGGGAKPHYGPIVLVGDPDALAPMANAAAAVLGPDIFQDINAALVLLGQFFGYHLPGIQAYALDVVPDPGVVPWLGIASGPVHEGFGDLTIPEFLEAAADKGILVQP